MNGMDTWLNLLVQIPLVGIFVWFILERDKRSNASQLERDKEWRDFMREQREAHTSSISRLAEEIKAINGQVGMVAGILASMNINKPRGQK